MSYLTPRDSIRCLPFILKKFLSGNIASGPDEYGTQAMQSGELVIAMTSFLESTHRHIKKESLWVLSNLTAGPTEHIDAFIQAGTLPLVVNLMSSTFDIKKEVLGLNSIYSFFLNFL